MNIFVTQISSASSYVASILVSLDFLLKALFQGPSFHDISLAWSEVLTIYKMTGAIIILFVLIFRF
jgi:hypothetical protein